MSPMCPMHQDISNVYAQTGIQTVGVDGAATTIVQWYKKCDIIMSLRYCSARKKVTATATTRQSMSCQRIASADCGRALRATHPAHVQMLVGDVLHHAIFFDRDPTSRPSTVSETLDFVIVPKMSPDFRPMKTSEGVPAVVP